MKIVTKQDWKRDDVLNLLEGDKNVGVELGVAEGGYSKRMVDSGKFLRFFGVDMYADMHDTNEYKKALRNVGLDKNYNLLRMRFDEALDLFEDNSLDFIYVDGYAHTGQLGGETIAQWYPKLKVGGVLSGDDYDQERWPLVVEAVNFMAKQIETDLYLTGIEESDGFSRYKSWAIIKVKEQRLELSNKMVKKGKFASWHKSITRPVVIGIKNNIPKPIKKKIKKILKRGQYANK